MLLNQLEALSDKTRLRMLALISRCSKVDNMGATTQQVAETLKIRPGVASHHLTILANSGILSRVQSGKYAIFTLNKSALSYMLAELDEVTQGQVSHESL